MVDSIFNQIEKFSLYKKYFNIYQKQLFGTPFIPILERKLEKLKFLESDIAFPQITGIDNLGNSIKMSNFKNKYLYIDIWATWCGPCIREIPAS